MTLAETVLMQRPRMLRHSTLIDELHLSGDAWGSVLVRVVGASQPGDSRCMVTPISIMWIARICKKKVECMRNVPDGWQDREAGKRSDAFRVSNQPFSALDLARKALVKRRREDRLVGGRSKAPAFLVQMSQKPSLRNFKDPRCSHAVSRLLSEATRAARHVMSQQPLSISRPSLKRRRSFL